MGIPGEKRIWIDSFSHTLYFRWVGGQDKEPTVLLRNVVVPKGEGGPGDPPDMHFRLKAFCFFTYCELLQGGQPIKELVMAADTTVPVTARMVLGNAGIPDSGEVSLTVPSDLGTADPASKELNAGRALFYIQATGAGGPKKLKLENTKLFAEEKKYGEPTGLKAEPFEADMTVVKLELVSVTFSGAKCFNLMDDLGAAYRIPHWTATTQSPVGYVRNSSMRVSARFKVTPAGFPDKIAIMGTTLIAGEFPGSSVKAVGGFATYPSTPSSGTLPNFAAYHNSVPIDWWYQPNKAPVPGVAGTSQNPVYVSLKAPKTSNLYRSVVHYACGRGNSPDEHFSAETTWGWFAGPANIKTWDGTKALTYYKAGLRNYVTTKDLLRYGNGACNAFANLLMDAWLVNDIDCGIVQVLPPKIKGIGWLKYFGVKNLRFVGPGTYAGIPPPNFVYSDNKGEVDISPKGIPGQNTDPPAEKLFVVHFILKRNGLYHDPSYGVRVADNKAYTTAAIDAYGYEDKTFTDDRYATQASVGTDVVFK